MTALCVPDTRNQTRLKIVEAKLDTCTLLATTQVVSATVAGVHSVECPVIC